MDIATSYPLLDLAWTLAIFALFFGGIAVIVGATVQVIRTPSYAFVMAQSSKALWLTLILATLPLPGISAIMAIIYLTSIRPRVNATKDASGAWPIHASKTAPPAVNNLPVAGWYADPESPSSFRWWNGRNWTESKAPNGPASPPPVP